MELHELIRHLRTVRGLSQDELAGMVGYKDRSSIAKVESGKVDLSQTKVAAFARALGVTPAYLLGIESDSTPLPPSAHAVDMSRWHEIPILGQISAGLPLYAEQHVEGRTMTDRNGGAEYFGLRVKGDSMNAMGICDGYTIIVRRQEEVENGEVAVVMVGDEDATVKRFYRSGDLITLIPQSTNPEHKIQEYDPSKIRVEVLGKVVEVKFSL